MSEGQGSETTGDSERIIVGIDGSALSQSAAQWAARQAELTGAKVELIATWEWPSSYGWVPPLPADYDPAGQAQTMLDELQASLVKEHPDIDIASSVVQGHPSPVLVDASEDADLLVVGSRGHGEFAGMLIGSVSQHCVTNAHCPVLVMRPRTSG